MQATHDQHKAQMINHHKKKNGHIYTTTEEVKHTSITKIIHRHNHKNSLPYIEYHYELHCKQCPLYFKAKKALQYKSDINSTYEQYLTGTPLYESNIY